MRVILGVTGVHTIELRDAELVVLSAAVNSLHNELTDKAREDDFNFVRGIAEEACVDAEDVFEIADDFIVSIPSNFKEGKPDDGF